jgi:hypothetical protein
VNFEIFSSTKNLANVQNVKFPFDFKISSCEDSSAVPLFRRFPLFSSAHAIFPAISIFLASVEEMKIFYNAIK